MPHRRIPLLLLLCAVVAPGVTFGQADPPAVEDQITVTAQRVEEDLQDVPISIIAVGGEEIENQAISDVQDLADSAPGLVVSGQSSSTGELALTIRGIGSNTFGLGTESTVGYYVDGVYMPRPQGFLNQFLDLERIEVLRGPQGTLWGRNTTGGAIHLVTRRPEGQFAGRVFGSYGEIGGPADAGEQSFSASLTGPLGEKLLGRISATQTTQEDYTFNEALGRTVDNVDGYGVRGALTFLPSDDVSATLRVDATDNDSHNNFNLRPGDVGPTTTLGTLLRFFELQSPSDTYRIAANIAPESEYEETGLSLDVEWMASPNVQLQSISSYREYESFRRTDVDATPLDFVENLGTFDHEWWSQELKLNGGNERVEWIAGLYAFHEEGNTNVDTRTDFALFEVAFFANNPGFFLFNPADFCSLGFLAPSFLCGIDYYGALAPFIGLSLPGNVSTGNFFITDLETDSYAAYGQLYWSLTDKLTLTTGLRYTYDEKSHDQTTIDFLTQQPLSLADEGDWDALTPKIGLEYRANDDTLVYGSITTGFKSGGFNSISLQPSFDEETITSYEVGVKSAFADRRVTLNATAFHYEYDDLQVAVLFPDRSSVENAAEATVDGLELDLLARPTDAFSVQLGISVLDDEFDAFATQDPVAVAEAQDALNAMGIFDPAALAAAALAVPTTDLSGRGLLRAPDLTANLALEYRFDLGDAGALVARGQAVYSDDVTYDPFERFQQDSYELFHANVSWSAPGGGWFVNLYGRNLGGEEIKVNEIFARVTGSLQAFGAPEQYGVQVGVDF